MSFVWLLTLLPSAQAALLGDRITLDPLPFFGDITDLAPCEGWWCLASSEADAPVCESTEFGAFGIDRIETCGDCTTTFYADGSSVESCYSEDCPESCHLGSCTVTTWDDGAVYQECHEDQGGSDPCDCEAGYSSCVQNASFYRDYCYSNAGEGSLDEQAARCDELYAGDLAACDAEELACDGNLWCD